MYDRAPRILVATAPTNSTPSTIGPGVYWNGEKEIRSGFAPFMSMSKRESFLTMTDQVATAPGPGQYLLVQNDLDKIKGGSTLQNRSSRFDLPSPKAPGPGTYSINSAFSKKLAEQPVFSTYPRAKAKTLHGRVTFTRLKTAPSIPFPGQSYGYEEDDSGQLVAKEIPEKDPTIGPTYYNVTNNVSAVSKRYKGIHFGKLKSQRTQFKGKDGPGPGEYDPKQASKGASITVQKGSAHLPRYHQIVPQLEEKKGVPGPGKYRLPSQFSDIQISSLEATAQPPFGCSQQRFLSTYPQSPAPTKYDNPTTAFESLKRVSGLSKSPFGQTSARFRTSKKSLEMPGPGSYNDAGVTSMANKVMKKTNVFGLKQNAFGTSSIRTVPMTKRDEKDLPGPAMYQETVPSSPKPDKVTAVFKSSTQRLYSPPQIVSSIPPPGSYDVLESYSHLQGKVDTKKSTLNSAFMSSNSRFAPPRDIMLHESDQFNPGPGEYDPDLTSRIGTKRNGLLCSKEERFKVSPKSALGPSTYRFSKSQTDTLLKGTFNATLNNPLSVEEDMIDVQRSARSTDRQTIVLNT